MSSESWLIRSIAVTLLVALARPAIAQEEETGQPPAIEGQTDNVPFDDDDADSPGVTVESFDEPLEPYGRWVETIRYGRAWHPENMPDDWRPYSYGRWECTEMGWMFVSEHPWGWACYHYGRWLNTSDNGWIWIPGTVWAPAWVAWRTSNEHIGWAPLPPEPHYYHASTVIVEERYYHRDFVFVSGHCFCEPIRPVVFVPAAHQVNIINQTTNVTQVRVVNKTVINNGPRISQVQNFTNKPVTVVRVKEVQRTEINNFHQDVAKIAPQKAQRIASVTQSVETSTNARVEKVQKTSPEVRQRAQLAVASKEARTDAAAGRSSNQPTSKIATSEDPIRDPKKADQTENGSRPRINQGAANSSTPKAPKPVIPGPPGQSVAGNPNRPGKSPSNPPDDLRKGSEPNRTTRIVPPPENRVRSGRPENARPGNMDSRPKKKDKKDQEDAPPK